MCTGAQIAVTGTAPWLRQDKRETACQSETCAWSGRRARRRRSRRSWRSLQGFGFIHRPSLPRLLYSATQMQDGAQRRSGHAWPHGCQDVSQACRAGGSRYQPCLLPGGARPGVPVSRRVFAGPRSESFQGRGRRSLRSNSARPTHARLAWLRAESSVEWKGRRGEGRSRRGTATRMNCRTSRRVSRIDTYGGKRRQNLICLGSEAADPRKVRGRRGPTPDAWRTSSGPSRRIQNFQCSGACPTHATRATQANSPTDACPPATARPG